MRRMHGASRFDYTCDSDVVFRRNFNIQRIDSLLMKRRLAYFARLAKSDCTILISLLALRFESCQHFCSCIGYSGESLVARRHNQSGFSSPWVRLIIDDLKCLCKYVPGLISSKGLPVPDEDGIKTWWQNVERESSIDHIFFHESRCDRIFTPCSSVTVHVCVTCNLSFATSKAPASHSRMKHGTRTPARVFADKDGHCRTCSTVFCSCTRLIADLTDAPRPKCIEWLTDNFSPLPDHVIAQLDADDKKPRRGAITNGFSQPRSNSIAMRGGRPVGVCRGQTTFFRFRF